MEGYRCILSFCTPEHIRSSQLRRARRARDGENPRRVQRCAMECRCLEIDRSHPRYAAKECVGVEKNADVPIGYDGTLGPSAKRIERSERTAAAQAGNALRTADLPDRGACTPVSPVEGRGLVICRITRGDFVSREGGKGALSLRRCDARQANNDDAGNDPANHLIYRNITSPPMTMVRFAKKVCTGSRIV